MSEAFTRTLVINSKDLGVEATLMLTFDDPSTSGLYEDKYPLCWRVSTFGAHGPYVMTATYINQLAFSRPQIVNGNVISASTYVDINLGQSSTLSVDNRRVYHFSPPSKGLDGEIQAVNGSGTPQDIAIGFDNGEPQGPAPVLYFPKVGDGSNVTAQFTPTLRAYLTSNYQENQILRGAIQAPMIWSQNLAEFGDTTYLTLHREPSTGRYSLVQA